MSYDPYSFSTFPAHPGVQWDNLLDSEGNSLGSGVLDALMQDWGAADWAEADWYARQGQSTEMMGQGLTDYLSAIEGASDDYRGRAMGLGGKYRRNIGGIASGMMGRVENYNRMLEGSIGGNIDKFLGQVGGLYDDNRGAISRYLSVLPQFGKIGGQFEALAGKSERMADRALGRGSAWGSKIANAGEGSRRRLLNYGNDALADMKSASGNVEQAANRIRNRTRKTDEFATRLEKAGDELFTRFEEYSSKVVGRGEKLFSKLGRWAEKAVDFAVTANARADIEINNQIASQGAAMSKQFDAARQNIMNSGMPDDVKMQELNKMDREAANQFVAQGAQTQNAATQMKWSMDEGVASMMMSAGAQEVARGEMWTAMTNGFTQMASFIMSQGQPSLYAAANQALSIGTQAEIAAADMTMNAGQLLQAGHALKIDAATKGESLKLQGLEAGARAESVFFGVANQAMGNAIQALNGKLNATFGQADVLKGAAQLQLSASAQMQGAFEHASNLSAQASFASNSNSVQAVFRAADLAANAEGNIYQGNMSMESNIYDATTRSYEIGLNQINQIAAHHASYKANPVSVADIFFGLMNAEATSYNAFGSSMWNQPGLGQLQGMA